MLFVAEVQPTRGAIADRPEDRSGGDRTHPGGRFTSRGGVHGRRTKRQLANCFRWLYVRTSFLIPRRPCRRPPTRCGGRGRPWTGDRRTHSWATTEIPGAMSSRWRALSATQGVYGEGDGCAAERQVSGWSRSSGGTGGTSFLDDALEWIESPWPAHPSAAAYAASAVGVLLFDCPRPQRVHMSRAYDAPGRHLTASFWPTR
jgi:hypothetical protein